MKKIIIIISLISLSVQVDHCIIEEPVCKTCKEGYYLVLNQYCVEIEHCTYISGGLCSSCEGNYQPSEDRKSCVMKPSEQIIEHCTSTRINYPDTLQCYKCENAKMDMH